MGFAQECPADKAAEKEHNPFSTFHEVMAPAWHEAYPARDFVTLLAAGPKFETAFVELKGWDPKLTSEIKKARYSGELTKFGELVTVYAEKAKAGDTEAVYAMLPDVHTAFERAASALVPVTYKEFDALVVALDLIKTKHLPEENQEGIVGSTERLVEVAGLLNEETLPHMLIWSSEEVLAEMAKMQTIVAEMKKCCDANDMTKYREQADLLETEAKTFQEKFL
jgi:hypothetical protein